MRVNFLTTFTVDSTLHFKVPGISVTSNIYNEMTTSWTIYRHRYANEWLEDNSSLLGGGKNLGHKKKIM